MYADTEYPNSCTRDWDRLVRRALCDVETCGLAQIGLGPRLGGEHGTAQQHDAQQRFGIHLILFQLIWSLSLRGADRTSFLPNECGVFVRNATSQTLV
jgi:hypothetical protein